jgi:integrase
MVVRARAKLSELKSRTKIKISGQPPFAGPAPYHNCALPDWRAIGKDEDGKWFEKDTKSHQQRRVVADLAPAVCRSRERRNQRGTSALEGKARPGLHDRRSCVEITRMNLRGECLDRPTYTFLNSFTGGTTGELAVWEHKFRHQGRTEDGESSRPYRRSCPKRAPLPGGPTSRPPRMPDRPGAAAIGPSNGSSHPSADEESQPSRPYVHIAHDLRAAIRCGALDAGDRLPPVKELARRYGIAIGTAHRAIAQRVAESWREPHVPCLLLVP